LQNTLRLVKAGHEMTKMSANGGDGGQFVSASPLA